MVRLFDPSAGLQACRPGPYKSRQLLETATISYLFFLILLYDFDVAKIIGGF